MNASRNRSLIGAALIALFGTAGCAGPEAPPDSVALGNAVSHNAAQHIIDPDPATARAGPPDLDGARAADAVQRYRTGKVIKPEPIETSTFGELR